MLLSQGFCVGRAPWVSGVMGLHAPGVWPLSSPGTAAPGLPWCVWLGTFSAQTGLSALLAECHVCLLVCLGGGETFGHFTPGCG